MKFKSPLRSPLSFKKVRRWSTGELQSIESRSHHLEASSHHSTSLTILFRPTTQAKSWKGAGMSQDDFMKKDECLLLNEEDRVLGQASKYDCHRFTPEQVCGWVEGWVGPSTRGDWWVGCDRSTDPIASIHTNTL